MPYYVGAGEPQWDEYCELEEGRQLPPQTLLKYVEPWEAKTTVVSFSETPGREPEVPPEIPYPFAPSGNREHKPGLMARLLGRKSTPMAPQVQISPKEYWESWRQRQSALCAHEMWKVSKMAAQCRTLSVKRIYGRYDGGGDESFTYLFGAEMNDGRKVAPDALPKGSGVDFEQLFETAIFAIMGSYDAGEFVLRGAAIVDFAACTVTDERNADVVFGGNTMLED
ncbi:MAG: hypothetical protein ACLPPF_17165 [Rhodomicrobium sp.]